MSNLIKDSSNKKGLGRGLGSLLGGHSQASTSAPTNSFSSQAPAVKTDLPAAKPALAAALAEVVSQIPADARIWKISIDKLVPGIYQPRQSFDKEKLQELAGSIKSTGILQPIVARKSGPNKFEIIAGERRWRAAQIAGLHEVPVIIKEIENKVALEMSIVENVQREDLNPIEEAEAYQRLADDFGFTQNEIAEKVSKDRVTVANLMRILSLPKGVREFLSQGQLSTGHAKVLLSLNDSEKQMELAQKTLKETLSVRKLEQMVQATKDKSTDIAAAVALAEQSKDVKKDAKIEASRKLVLALADDLQKTLKTKVTIDYKNDGTTGKGQVNIHFYTDDELTEIVDRLKS